MHNSGLTIYLKATQTTALCPGCNQLATKIQSRYQRRLADLNWANCRVQLNLRSRRFFCPTTDCPRRVFCERLPELTQVYARRTNRLTNWLTDLAKALGSRPAARLALKQNLLTSRSSLLRLLAKLELKPYPTPRVVGVDEFALKKGQTYATILVDLEKHQPIEVLADDSSETFGKWLAEHPGIEVISRDRDGSYAKAARKMAPQALQVADRFHILASLRQYVADYFKRTKIWQAAPKPAEKVEVNNIGAEKPPLKSVDLPPLAESSIELATNLKMEHSLTKEAQLKAERYQNRLSRYQKVRELAEEGLSSREIARELRLDKITINRYLKAEDAQEAIGSKPKEPRPSLLDPYKVYLYQRWCEDQPTIKELQQELRSQGYGGSSGPIRAFLAHLRPQPYWSSTRTKVRAYLSNTQIPALSTTKPITSRKASWLIFLRDKEDETLSEEQRQLLFKTREKNPQNELVYQLVQAFRKIIREKGKEGLGDWLERAKDSKIKELVSFCNGLERDRAAVEAGLSTQYSNGQTEGQVNRVKNIKRQMYGRASFKLLRTRILAA